MNETEQPAQQPPSWQPMNLDAYLDGTYRAPEPKYFQRTDGVCLLYPGYVHSIMGESESGKSLIVQHEAAVLVGQQLDVLYLDFESDAASVLERLGRFGTQPQDLREHFAYVSPHVNPDKPAHNGAAEQDAYRALLSRPWAMVVIDGVTAALAVYGMGSNDNDEVTQFLHALPDRFARATGAAVVLIDHQSKSSDTRGRFAIGAQAKMAGLSGPAFVAEPKGPLGRGRRGSIELRVAKDRAGWLRDKCGPWRARDRTQVAAIIDVDSTHGQVTQIAVLPPEMGPDEHRPFRPTSLMEKVSRHLEDMPEPHSVRQVQAMVQGKATELRLALELLVTEGYAAKTTGPRGAHLHSSTRPYRQHADPKSDRYTGQPLLDDPDQPDET